MSSNPKIPAGSITQLFVESKELKKNMLGDPTNRVTKVYLPHDYKGGTGLPLLVALAPFTSSGLAFTNWKLFSESLPERIDRLIHRGKLPPVVVAFPDCFTRLGGNQFINSKAMGNWENYLIKELVPAIEKKFKCGGVGRRGVFGKSSGGYGSLIHALLHSDFWSTAVCHSGDMGFETCYLPEFPNLIRGLAQKDNSIKKFILDFEKSTKVDGKNLHNLMTMAMAATYDPDPKGFCGIRLPVTMDTCEVIEARWENWLKWDPINMVDKYYNNLKNLKLLWIDCGTNDQYNLLYGARRFAKKLQSYKIRHIYEEFEDNHSSIDYRLDLSLPKMVKALNSKTKK